jgi:hypothetical protein
MQKGQLQIIPNAGHACSLDQPEVYNQALQEFGESIGWIKKKFTETKFLSKKALNHEIEY